MHNNILTWMPKELVDLIHGFMGLIHTDTENLKVNTNRGITNSSVLWQCIVNNNDAASIARIGNTL